MTMQKEQPMSFRTQPKLLDRVRQASRLRHYSRRTEEAYVGWIRRFIVFHSKRHPMEMGEPEVTRFLTSLATDRQVSASTQNQALSAILFLYEVLLGRRLAWMNDTSARSGRSASRLCCLATRWRRYSRSCAALCG